MSKKVTQSAKVAAILKRLGATKEAEAEIVKRLKMNPHTAHFYRWRFERTGSVLKSPTRKKGSKNLRGAVAGKKAAKSLKKKVVKRARKTRAFTGALIEGKTFGEAAKAAEI